MVSDGGGRYIPAGIVGLHFFFFGVPGSLLVLGYGTRVTCEMVSGGGGQFIPAGIVGLDTLSLLFASLVAHDRATEDNYTTHSKGAERPPTNTTEHYSWVQYISLDREVLTPPPCE